MKILTSNQAYDNLKSNIKTKTHRIPGKFEPGCEGELIIPKLFPRFKLAKNEKVFTIGSCFAREIESILAERGFDVPVNKFTLPSGEIVHPAPHLLNEYNVGTILQRVRSIVNDFSYGNKGIEKIDNNNYIDLFLHIHQEPTRLERLLERREQIQSLYAKLLECNTVIITMGLTECWYDVENECYLNKAPSKKSVTANPDKFQFHRMDLEDVFGKMRDAITLLNRVSHKNILITVSPVPLEATFMNNNAVMSNSYSKSVLRAAAELLKEQFDNVDYFPSYEIALSAGLSGMWSDNVHIDRDVVSKITSHMLNSYFTDLSDKDKRQFSENYIDREYKEI